MKWIFVEENIRTPTGENFVSTTVDSRTFYFPRHEYT
jgi:hypothetical protein